MDDFSQYEVKPATRVGTEKGRKTNPSLPADDFAQYEVKTPEYNGPGQKSESMFSRGVKDVVQGVAELPVTMATGLVSTVLGDAGGMVLDAGNTVRKAFGAEPTRLRIPGTDRVTSEGRELQQGIKQEGTYQPRSTTGKVVGNVLSYIPGKIAEGTTAAGEAMGIPGTVAETLGDVAATVIPIKAAPKVAKIAKAAPGKALDVGLDLADAATSTSGAIGVGTVGSLLAGNPLPILGGAALRATNPVVKYAIRAREASKERTAIANAEKAKTAEVTSLFDNMAKEADAQYAAEAPMRAAKAEKARVEAELAAKKAAEVEAAKAVVAEEIATGVRNKWGDVVEKKPEVSAAPQLTAAEKIAQLRTKKAEEPRSTPAKKSVAEMLAERTPEQIEALSQKYAKESSGPTKADITANTPKDYSSMPNRLIEMQLARKNLDARLRKELESEMSRRSRLSAEAYDKFN